MRAAVVTRYGPPERIRVREAAKPAPADDEVLIRVHAASVNRTDCGELRAHPVIMRLFTGLLRPRRTILGMDVAGEVEAVGAGIVSVRPGERVFGLCPSRRNGAQADYVCVPERAIAPMPAGVKFHEAVVGEGAFYAQGLLEQIGLKAGDDILIHGASGAIGVAMVQLATAAGARVTAVVATPQLALAGSLGAERAVDYTAEDFTAIGRTFDFVVDAVGKTTFFRCRRLLKPRGTFAATDLGPGAQNVLLALWSWVTRSRRAMIAVPRRLDGFVPFLKALMEAGRFRAVVDRRYPLDRIADAYRYVETGRKVGIVVVDVVEGEGR